MTPSTFLLHEPERLVFEGFIPFLPPSVNRAYTIAHNRKILSPQARKYKMEAFEALKGSMPTHKKGDSYILGLNFFMENLENKGWPNTKNRYKKRDVSNWIKLVEDVVSTYTGIDDSSFLRTDASKFDAVEINKEGSSVFLWRIK